MKTPQASAPNILIVDDIPENLDLLGLLLEEQGYNVRKAHNGQQALKSAVTSPPDLILLDIDMPDINGYEVCARLKALGTVAKVPVIFLSAFNEAADKVAAFSAGGIDYVTKPFQVEEVWARVGTHLKLRRLQLELEESNQHLQDLVQEQVREIVDSQMATIFALAKLAESRDDNTGNHIRRVQSYCKTLALRLKQQPPFQTHIDAQYIENLFHTSALHDIGKVGIPDSVLLKPHRLTPEEMAVMKTHTLIGARTLEEVLRSHPNNLFIKMGVTIARSHHERWDGSGYPDGLKGEAIPLSARILTLADQYDALRNARPYKPPFDHEKTCDIILEGDGRTLPEHFDPQVLRGFADARDEFDDVFKSLSDRD